MMDYFEETTQFLKEEYYTSVIAVVTKMDQYKPDDHFPSRASVEARIRELLADQDVYNVIFTEENDSATKNFSQFFNSCHNLEKISMHYTEEEFYEYFPTCEIKRGS